jgi:predicted PurR-regulated permease PerM
MEDILVIAFGAFIAYVCYVVAEKNGRMPVPWAIAGFFLTIFALAALWMVGRTEEKILEEAKQSCKKTGET